jgi:hypothetical protein
MPRTVNEAAHAERRNAFLNAAQRLIGTMGYERMTIQDVLNDLSTVQEAQDRDTERGLRHDRAERPAQRWSRPVRASRPPRQQQAISANSPAKYGSSGGCSRCCSQS